MPGATPVEPAPVAGAGDRTVSEQDKKLAGEWLSRINAALKRVEDDFKGFDLNRKRMAGKKVEVIEGVSSKETVRANLHFANMAAMLPQIYAKDPEFAAQPTQAVPPAQLEATRKFAKTAEFMVSKVLVKDARLKVQAKKVIRSAFGTSVGWIKASWQEKMGADPLIANRLHDTQDNIERIELLLAQATDPDACSNHELKLAELREAMAGLETQQEVVVAKGMALDFVMSEDVLVVDPAVRSVTDYLRAGALAHRVWMTPDAYQQRFGYKPKKAKTYTEQAGKMSSVDDANKSATLLCVWEVWSQDDSRIFYVCDGEEGFCEEPSSPDWTGKRWYPFFLLAFNEIDGKFYPLSDVELNDKLVQEHNKNRDDFVKDRKGARPFVVVRKGGSLTPDDVKNITNRDGNDTITVDGVSGQPLANDIQAMNFGEMKAEAYDTTPADRDMERLIGGGDAPTGSITKAKTATEAEILSQGLRGRSAERTDTLEDMLNELGPFALEVMLRKLTEAEVQALAGPDAAWPTMSIDEVFNLVNVEVRGGSTGKPDRLQEQDRWTKLLPIINEAVAKVSELRQQGQEGLAQAVIKLLRETLRRFDERIDIEEFLPQPPQEGQPDPAQLAQELAAAKQQMEAMSMDLKKATDLVHKGMVSAAASIATSANPQTAVLAFLAALGVLDPAAVPATPQPEQPEPGEAAEPPLPTAEELPQNELPPDPPFPPVPQA